MAGITRVLGRGVKRKSDNGAPFGLVVMISSACRRRVEASHVACHDIGMRITALSGGVGGARFLTGLLDCIGVGDEVTVKRFKRNKHLIELHPENPDYQIIVVEPGESFEIEGLAVGLIRNTMLM